MANSTLFYNVSADKAVSFKQNKASEKVIGFVAPKDASQFGYIITGGKQFGPSYSDVEKMVKQSSTSLSIDSKNNSLEGNGGAKYTFTITNGQLSVKKYLATTVTGLTTSFLVSATSSGGGDIFIGSAYNLLAGMAIPSDDNPQTIHYTINNSTGNDWALTGIQYGSTYIYGKQLSISSTGTLVTSDAAYNYKKDTSYTGSFTITESMSGYFTAPASASVIGTLAWGPAKTAKVTLASRNFTIFIHENGKQSFTKGTATIGPSVSNASATVNAKANYYINNSKITATNKGTATTIKYGASLPKELTFGPGNPSIAFPTQFNVKSGFPKFKQLGVVATDWVQDSAEITIDNVKYTVMYKTGKTQANAVYTVEWQ